MAGRRYYTGIACKSCEVCESCSWREKCESYAKKFKPIQAQPTKTSILPDLWELASSNTARHLSHPHPCDGGFCSWMALWRLSRLVCRIFSGRSSFCTKQLWCVQGRKNRKHEINRGHGKCINIHHESFERSKQRTGALLKNFYPSNFGASQGCRWELFAWRCFDRWIVQTCDATCVVTFW